jgi:hypothetical protein
MVIAWTRATPSLRGSGLYFPPISEKCVARLATQFLPAGSREAFEMTVQRHAGTELGCRAPLGEGDWRGLCGDRRAVRRHGWPSTASWLLPCAATRGDGPLFPAGDNRTAPADTRSDQAEGLGGRGYPEPWTRDDERAFGTPLNPPVGRPANAGVVIMYGPKDVRVGVPGGIEKRPKVRGALARPVAFKSTGRDRA